jgi:hypothetical protein
VTPPPPAATASPPSGAAAKARPTPVWPTPHAFVGEVITTDERFDADGLRVQSTQKRDAAKVCDAYRDVLGELRAFLAASDVAAARAVAADFHPPPLNLVIVPQAQLDEAALWPGLPANEGMTYTSRYILAKRTLFVNDTRGFERHDLAYGVAQHVLSPVAAVDNDTLGLLAEKFERRYNNRSK